MEKSIIATGKTIDLAIQAALNELKMDRDAVSVEVLENAKSGFLGIGASPAKVKVTYEAPDAEAEAAPAPALSAASRSKPKKQRLPKEEKPAAKQPAAQASAAPASPAKPAEKKPARPQQEKRPAPQQEAKPAAPKASPKEYPVAAPGSMEARIEAFMQGLLTHMGSDAVPHAVATGEDTYMVELVGENLGALIGRRGDTLDAIQHLTNYAVNRGETKRVRINVDAESYRAKREESLQRLAKKVGAKVTKYRRNITLEPMNAYERHVIHAALQDMPDVTTFSTGTEPNRRIVVAYSRYRNFDEKQ